MLLTFHTGHEVNIEFDDALHSYVVAHKLDKDFTDFRPTHGVTTPLQMIPKEYLKKWVAKLCTNSTLEYICAHPELVDTLPRFLQDMQDYYDVTLDENGKKVMTYYRFNKQYPWYRELKKAPDQQSGIGKELGTWIHAAIEEFYKSDRKTLPINTPDTQGMWDSFIQFDNFFKPKTESTEFFVYSLMFGYSGQGDWRGQINGKYCYIDWKSTNRSESNPDGIGVDGFYQGGGIAQAEFERTGKWFDDLAIVNLDKKGGEPRVIFASEFGASPQDMAKAYVTFFHGHHMHTNWDYKFSKR